jgi:glyoxylase-like metal-dependent hydrolase (beta-lactamase superfamily II)
MFQTEYLDSPSIDSVVFTGDVLFAGSIGRTDLPGGNLPDMLKSLRTKVLPLPDAAAVLPDTVPRRPWAASVSATRICRIGRTVPSGRPRPA